MKKHLLGQKNPMARITWAGARLRARKPRIRPPEIGKSGKIDIFSITCFGAQRAQNRAHKLLVNTIVFS